MKSLTMITLLTCSIIPASGQKLPNIQEGGMSAPMQVQVDGAATEWGRQLQAYNKATMIYYTLANDKDNLYMVVQAYATDIVRKIVADGITLKIKDLKDKKGASLLSLTYPVLPIGKNKGKVINSLQDTTNSSPAFLLELNNTLEEASNEIPITGFRDIPDSAISVYNDYGIKVGQNLNSKRVYTYELALPLKHLRGMMNTEAAFAYEIRLNGPDPKKVIRTAHDAYGRELDPNSPEILALEERLNQANPYFFSLNSPTYLSGTYRLKK